MVCFVKVEFTAESISKILKFILVIRHINELHFIFICFFFMILSFTDRTPIRTTNKTTRTYAMIKQKYAPERDIRTRMNMFN